MSGRCTTKQLTVSRNVVGKKSEPDTAVFLGTACTIAMGITHK